MKGVGQNTITHTTTRKRKRKGEVRERRIVTRSIIVGSADILYTYNSHSTFKTHHLNNILKEKLISLIISFTNEFLYRKKCL